MNPLTEIGLYVIQTLGTLYILTVLLRFLLQVARADFYNPISQFVVKATNPLVIPLRKVFPSIAGYDTASIILALLLEALVIVLCGLIAVGSLINPVDLITWSLIGLVSMTVYVFYFGLIIMIIVSFVAPHSQHPALMLIRQLTNPICAPFQRIIPPMGGLDISPIFVFIALHIVRILLTHGAKAVGLASLLVPGI